MSKRELTNHEVFLTGNDPELWEGIRVLMQTANDANDFIHNLNIFLQNGITKAFLYPSNIVSCEDPLGLDIDAILRNIEQISPVLAIHTDLNYAQHPEKVFLTTDQNPKAVKRILFHKDSYLANMHRIKMLQSIAGEVSLLLRQIHDDGSSPDSDNEPKLFSPPSLT